ncbi:regulator of microtubule dynamics protein 1-like [Centruroides sculpturatus]|uniref:regulator of microtubule dynamics protein 1-like n=1 Tax=Centruroides sculpturatus TaxID=218467 RepID=UPI000C6EFEBA|nr:regulator of microtubule dynamics protein 1-like [Centruroides sculpturatus]
MSGVTKFSRILTPIFRMKKINWKYPKFELRKIIQLVTLHQRSSFISFLPSWTVLFIAACKKNEKMDFRQYDKVIKTADEMYDNKKYKEAYDLLHQESFMENDEVLWRLARICYELAHVTKANEERVSLLREAFSYAEKAIQINDNNNNSHRWYGLLLDYVAREVGTKERLIKSKLVRKHIEKAIEICPTDTTSLYILGNWCYSFADLPWYQRKIASVIFASPPTSTYEEALQFFEKAEEIEPNFYSMNLLYLGKTYLKLNQKEKAVICLEKVKNYPLKTRDDQEAFKEAVELLKSLK